MHRTLLVTLAGLATLASAKLDYGACPSPVSQVPIDASFSLDGTYYFQYYDNMIDYLMPFAKFIYKTENFDCVTQRIKPRMPSYNRDALPLRKRLWQPYLIYQDPSKNAIVGYMCFDSRFLSDLIAVGLNIPDWATEYWNKFTELFQIWHLKLTAIGSKTPAMDPAVLSSVSDYINNFPYTKTYQYKFPADFSKVNQDTLKCGWA